MLDGVDIIAEEKVKAENLHGVDRNDRETIFKSLLPQEKFIDRRMQIIEEIEVESEDPESEDLS
jgi:protein phosphatase 1 regulatory subunit 7